MAQNSEGYMPFSRVAGGGASSISRGASDAHMASAQSRGVPGAATPEQHYAEPGSRPRPEMRPAPQGYGEPQDGYKDGYEPQASPAAVSAAQGRPVSPPEDPDRNLVILSRPYYALGEEVTRVRLRKPVARDVKKCGYPLRPVFADDGMSMKGYDILPDVIVKYIPLLSDPMLTPATVDQLEIGDLNAFSTVINRFFQE